MKRFGQVIKVDPDKIAAYKDYHANIWPEINAKISASNIRNYSIYLKDDYLFAYFEYVGDDFEADMAGMDSDPATQKWWAIMKPMQQPIETREEGEWWAAMEEVYHLD